MGRQRKKRPTELGKTHGLDLSYSALCVPLGSEKTPFGSAVTALYVSFLSRNPDQPVLQRDVSISVRCIISWEHERSPTCSFWQSINLQSQIHLESSLVSERVLGRVCICSPILLIQSISHFSDPVEINAASVPILMGVGFDAVFDCNLPLLPVDNLSVTTRMVQLLWSQMSITY